MQDEEKYKDHFLGVMGTDVPLDYLQEFMLQPLVSLICLKVFVKAFLLFNFFWAHSKYKNLEKYVCA